MSLWYYTVTIAGNPAAPPAGLSKGATIIGYGTLNYLEGIDMKVLDVQAAALGAGGTITFSVKISTTVNKAPFKDGNGSYGLGKVKIATQDYQVNDCHQLDKPQYVMPWSNS
jgi:hypothetical protein